MNDQIYATLRTIADSIRAEAVAMQNGDTAVRDFLKLTAFMFDEIHIGGQDIRIGATHSFAEGLKELSARIDGQKTHSRERLRNDLARLVDLYSTTCGSKFDGMASLGEDLLLSANAGDSTVTWGGLLAELKRRSG